MKKLFLAFVVLPLAGLLLAGCSLSPTARYGMYGGGANDDRPKDPPFDANAIDNGTRWFPTHLRFAPDDSNFLASLCHVRRPTFCRIGRYTLATKTWDILPFEPLRTYRWPTYSPDGKWIVTTTSPCDDQYRCNPGDHVLVKMRPDGTGVEKVGKDVLAEKATFSGNGKKLIYWKRFAVPTAKGMEMLGKKDVYSMDFETGQETLLTDILFLGEERDSQPFLTEDGQTVVLSGELFKVALRDHRTNQIEYSPEITRGENINVQRWAFDVKDAPLTREKAKQGKMWPVWRGESSGIGNFDMTLDGRLVYNDRISTRRALGSKVAKELDCGPDRDSAAFVRRPFEGAQDEAAFCYSLNAHSSLSSSRKLLIVSNSSSSLFHPLIGLELRQMGNSIPLSIDWPRLELK